MTNHEKLILFVFFKFSSEKPEVSRCFLIQTRRLGSTSGRTGLFARVLPQYLGQMWKWDEMGGNLQTTCSGCRQYVGTKALCLVKALAISVIVIHVMSHDGRRVVRSES